MNPISPCTYCKKRYPGCHGKCNDAEYLKWREEVKKAKNAKHKAKREEEIVVGYLSNASEKYKKRAKKAKGKIHGNRY